MTSENMPNFSETKTKQNKKKTLIYSTSRFQSYVFVFESRQNEIAACLCSITASKANTLCFMRNLYVKESTLVDLINMLCVIPEHSQSILNVKTLHIQNSAEPTLKHTLLFYSCTNISSEG